MSHVLIAGCGYVGTALAAMLCAEGHHVTGVRRSPATLPGGATLLAADLADPASLRAALGPTAPIEIAVYAAAAAAGDDASYARSYADGLGNLLALLHERGDPIGRTFFTSSTSVYGQDDGSLVDESSPTDPVGFRGARMLEAEGVLAASGFPATALRLGGIYGPGRTRVVERIESGRVELGAAPHFANRIHRDDAAGALAHLIALAQHGVAIPSLLLVVDDEPSDQADVLLWIASQLGLPEPGRRTTATPTGKRCSNARLRALGYPFRYPSFREGYAAAIAAALTRP